MEGWRRAMRWEDTGLPWVAPSPNMPTPDTARVYPGGCLIEGTNLSEGRGTTRPFELVGAPFLDGRRLAERATAAPASRRRLPRRRFEPAFHKWKGQLCEGVQVHVTDAARFKSFATYLALIIEARRQAPRRFRWRRPPYEFERRRLPIDLLCGGDAIRRAIERGASLASIERSWRSGLARFARARRPYLLYRDRDRAARSHRWSAPAARRSAARTRHPDLPEAASSPAAIAVEPGMRDDARGCAIVHVVYAQVAALSFADVTLDIRGSYDSSGRQASGATRS